MTLNNVIDRSERHIFRAARRFEQEMTLVRRTGAGDDEREPFKAIVNSNTDLTSFDGNIGSDSVNLDGKYEVEIMVTKDNALENIDTSFETNVTTDVVELNGYTYEVGDITETAYFQKMVLQRER